MFVARELFSCANPAVSIICMTNPQIPKKDRYPHSCKVEGNRKPTLGTAKTATRLTNVHQAAK